MPVASTSPVPDKEKLYPLLRKANADQLRAVYLTSCLIMKQPCPDESEASIDKIFVVFDSAPDNLKRIIYIICYHMIHK